MGLARSVPSILLTDLRRLLRDRFLLGTAAYIIGLALALRWVIPWLTAELATRSGFDLEPYLPLGVSYFVLVNASVLTGLVGGFLLLEQREERTLQAVLVTPTPISVQIGTLSMVLVATGAALALVESAAVGVGVPPWPATVTAALLGAPSGVVMALLLVTLAANKVEAFAVMKVTSVVGLVPVVAWFVPDPWQLLAGIVPPYWACRIWWAAAAGEPWGVYVLPGLAVTTAWIWALASRFRAIV